MSGKRYYETATPAVMQIIAEKILPQPAGEVLPASSGKFNLAGRKRPAAEPAAMGVLHHGIDLSGNFRAVVCLATPVADECRDIPDDNDLVPDPCNEFGLSFLQGSFTERTPLWNHSFSLLVRVSIQ